MKKLLLSIIICTHNREKLLPICLQSISSINQEKDQYEVIVVNNNSTDKTQEVAKKYIKANSNFRLVFEKELGLSNARNRGYKEAKGKYVAYIDDDAQIDKLWIKKAISIIKNNKPDIFGGPIYPLYLYEKPKWFKENYELRVHYQETGFIKEKYNLSGSNIVIKRNILEKLNGFDPDIGMKGNSLNFGEEIKLIKNYVNKYENPKMFYDFDLKINHYVDPKKYNILYSLKTQYIIGLNSNNIFRYKRNKNILILLGSFIGLFYYLTILLISFFLIPFRSRTKYKFINNYIKEVFGVHIYNFASQISKIKYFFLKSKDFYLP